MIRVERQSPSSWRKKDEFESQWPKELTRKPEKEKERSSHTSYLHQHSHSMERSGFLWQSRMFREELAITRSREREKINTRLERGSERENGSRQNLRRNKTSNIVFERSGK